MPTIIYVSLGPKKKPVLTYHDGTHEFEPDDFPQLIVWKLVGNLQNGNFRQPKTPIPGFAWDPPEVQPSKTQPPAGIFSDPAIGKHSKMMWMQNYHPDEYSEGEWTYTLGIDSGEALYRVTHLGKGKPRRTRTTNDPVIINKKQ